METKRGRRQDRDIRVGRNYPNMHAEYRPVKWIPYLSRKVSVGSVEHSRKRVKDMRAGVSAWAPVDEARNY